MSGTVSAEVAVGASANAEGASLDLSYFKDKLTPQWKMGRDRGIRTVVAAIDYLDHRRLASICKRLGIGSDRYRVVLAIILCVGLGAIPLWTRGAITTNISGFGARIPVWSPAWVSWRQSETTFGWAPLPIGTRFEAGASWPM